MAKAYWIARVDVQYLVVHDVVDHGLNQALGVAQVGAAGLARAQQDLARAEHRAPEHLLGATALRGGTLLVVEMARDAFLLDLHGRDRRDVLDAGLSHCFVDVLGDRGDPRRP